MRPRKFELVNSMSASNVIDKHPKMLCNSSTGALAICTVAEKEG
jgi:hypothetical protein